MPVTEPPNFFLTNWHHATHMLRLVVRRLNCTVTPYMHWPIVAILAQPCWGFPLSPLNVAIMIVSPTEQEGMLYIQYEMFSPSCPPLLNKIQ
jgi:hypothetical protein